ncbi:MAG: ribosome silencing factor [Longimicrobiales bacterium]
MATLLVALLTGADDIRRGTQTQGPSVAGLKKRGPRGARPDDLQGAIEAALDRKGRDLLVLDLRGISNATDFFLLVTGTSDSHVRSIAEHIIESMKAKAARPGHVEGMRGGRWVLIDFIDFVVHVFHPAARAFYQLERLWGDAPSYAPEEAAEEGAAQVG